MRQLPLSPRPNIPALPTLAVPRRGIPLPSAQCAAGFHTDGAPSALISADARTKRTRHQNASTRRQKPTARHHALSSSLSRFGRKAKAASSSVMVSLSADGARQDRAANTESLLCAPQITGRNSAKERTNEPTSHAKPGDSSSRKGPARRAVNEQRAANDEAGAHT